MNATTQLRIRLPAARAADFLLLPPELRGMAVAACLEASARGVVLADLVAGLAELRHQGVNLNHVLRLAHQNRGVFTHDDARRIRQCVHVIEQYRGS